MRVVENQEEWDRAPVPYGGLFNTLGPAAYIRDITFDNFIINFRHIDTALSPHRVNGNDASYYQRPQIINVFASTVASSTRARNVRINFSYREEYFVAADGWIGFGWGEAGAVWILDEIVGYVPDLNYAYGYGVPLTTFRQIMPPAYFEELEFRQIGPNFGGYFANVFINQTW